jgi:hypothetical protein
MKFLKTTAKCTLYDHRMNQDITKELKTQSVLEKSTTIKLNGYDMFIEWTDLNS